MKKGIFALSMLLAASVSFAADAPDFAALDADASGTISQDEAAGSMLEANFAEADLNGDGAIDEAEFMQIGLAKEE